MIDKNKIKYCSEVDFFVFVIDTSTKYVCHKNQHTPKVIFLVLPLTFYIRFLSSSVLTGFQRRRGHSVSV